MWYVHLLGGAVRLGGGERGGGGAGGIGGRDGVSPHTYNRGHGVVFFTPPITSVTWLLSSSEEGLAHK